VELRTYGQILWRRIWIVVLVVAIVGIYVTYQYYQSHKTEVATKTYATTVNMHIGLQSVIHAQSYSDYVNTSSTLADEFATGSILTSDTFATQVIQQIRNDMHTIKQRYGRNPSLGAWQDTSTIIKALSATHSHSMVAISVNWNTEAGAWAIAHAVGEVCENNMPTYLNYQVVAPTTQESTSPEYLMAGANVINQPTKPAEVDSGSLVLRKTQLLAILLVGLIVGLALAFLIEYLDDRIHNSEEVVQLLQLPMYGEIPQAPVSQGPHRLTYGHGV
jgi:capsular polysaccharide biosynthesis protein